MDVARWGGGTAESGRHREGAGRHRLSERRHARAARRRERAPVRAVARRGGSRRVPRRQRVLRSQDGSQAAFPRAHRAGRHRGARHALRRTCLRCGFDDDRRGRGRSRAPGAGPAGRRRRQPRAGTARRVRRPARQVRRPPCMRSKVSMRAG